jgi:hypothetical protein
MDQEVRLFLIAGILLMMALLGFALGMLFA